MGRKASNGYSPSTLMPLRRSDSCGKLVFASRKAAKMFIRKNLPSDHQRPYVCPTCGEFHTGHIASRVLYGDMTARERYSR